MFLIRQVLGNSKQDAEWRKKLRDVELDYLDLDQRDAHKNSCRKMTRKGRDLGVSLDRNVMLVDGDVLLYEPDKDFAVVVRITLREVMVIDLYPQLAHPPGILIQLGFELGHALGNQHWKAVIKGSRVFIPLSVARKMMNSVMTTHGFSRLAYRFVRGDSILPILSTSEARLLFGGAEDAGKHVHVTHNEQIHGDGDGQH